MNLNVYRIHEASVEAVDGGTDFFKAWKEDAAAYWIDIHSYHAGELEEWLENLKLSSLAMKCCLEAGQTNRFVPLKDEVFLEFPTFIDSAGSELIPLSFLCIQNLVVTLHAVPLPIEDGVINGLLSGLGIQKPTTSALVCILLLLESAKSLRISESLKKSVFEMDELMDEDPNRISADDILDQKRSLRMLDTVVDAQLNCFELMGEVNRPFIDLKTLATQFQFAPGNVRSANQTVDRLEKTITDIRQHFDMNQQDKTNHRLAILTILSAIFMPLTFIAGIYGMNFDKMPELHFSFSYPAVLIIMALIAGGMYLYFKTRGWLE